MRLLGNVNCLVVQKSHVLCRSDADGHLFLKGRLGEMIKTSGANVSPREVEQVLESFDGVKEAYVVGVADPLRAQAVVAAVVPYPDRTPDPADLRRRLRRELSVFKVPQHIFICDSEEIPRTGSTKIQKPLLREMLSDRIAASPAEP